MDDIHVQSLNNLFQQAIVHSYIKLPEGDSLDPPGITPKSLKPGLTLHLYMDIRFEKICIYV